MIPRVALFSLLAQCFTAALLVMVHGASAEDVKTTLSVDELRSRARQAARRSLPLLQASAAFWTDEIGCYSCHHQGMGPVSFALAREVGFAIDEAAAKREADAVRQYSLDRFEPLLNCDGIGVFGRSTILLSLGAHERPRDDVTDAVVHFLAARQTQSGAWYSNEHRPPFEDSHVTATALTVRALQLYAPDGRAEEMQRRIERARVYLEEVEPVNNEERSMRLMGLAWCGSEDALIQSAATDLAKRQRSDGGWSQIESLASDAYATGQALVVLNQAAGWSVNTPQWARAAEFLIQSQLADGSWRVVTRRRIKGLNQRNGGFPHGENQFISYFASVWATMALVLDGHGSARTLTLFGPGMARGEDSTGCEHGLTPLHLAAAFGSVEDVRRELDGGADPNSRGPRALTPIVLAVHDVNKVDLLLEHGADPHARTDWGFTALLAASINEEASASVERLLAEGASTACEGANGASPAFCAASTGNVELVQTLVDAGAQFPLDHLELALIYSATCNDVEMGRKLVELGADVNCVVNSGHTPLTSAVISGYLPFAAWLLAEGADLEALDEHGLTALAWAAKVDFGGVAMLQLLLEAGADVRARSDNGMSPRDWAVKYDNKQRAEYLRLAEEAKR